MKCTNEADFVALVGGEAAAAESFEALALGLERILRASTERPEAYAVATVAAPKELAFFRDALRRLVGEEVRARNGLADATTAYWQWLGEQWEAGPSRWGAFLREHVGSRSFTLVAVDLLVGAIEEAVTLIEQGEAPRAGALLRDAAAHAARAELEASEPEPCCGEFGTGSGMHGDECPNGLDDPLLGPMPDLRIKR